MKANAACSMPLSLVSLDCRFPVATGAAALVDIAVDVTKAPKSNAEDESSTLISQVTVTAPSANQYTDSMTSSSLYKIRPCAGTSQIDWTKGEFKDKKGADSHLSRAVPVASTQ